MLEHVRWIESEVNKMTDEELEAVRFRAYQIWEREDRPHGRHEDHWAQALTELGLNQPLPEAAPNMVSAQARKRGRTIQDQ